MYTQTSHKLYVYIDQITYTPSLGQVCKQIFRLRNCKQWSAAKIWKKRRFDCLCQILPNQHFTSYLTSLHTNQLFLNFLSARVRVGTLLSKALTSCMTSIFTSGIGNPRVCMWVVYLGIQITKCLQIQHKRLNKYERGGFPFLVRLYPATNMFTLFFFCI